MVDIQYVTFCSSQQSYIADIVSSIIHEEIEPQNGKITCSGHTVRKKNLNCTQVRLTPKTISFHNIALLLKDALADPS